MIEGLPKTAAEAFEQYPEAKVAIRRGSDGGVYGVDVRPDLVNIAANNLGGIADQVVVPETIVSIHD